MQKKNSIIKNTKILICCHKESDLPQGDLFLPIHVGAAISNVKLNMQRDDEVNGEKCDNISSKNKSFCELTAVYWAWKNIKKIYPDLEYIGLNHYRRFFNFDSATPFDSININPEEVKNYKLNEEKLSKILSKKNIVLAKKKVYPYSLFTNYCVCHYSDDFYTLQKTVDEVFPDYKKTFERVCFINNKVSPYNMMIMAWKEFDEYCSWLFGVLFKLEEKLDISSYSPSQGRIYGYMAERLLNVWCYKNYKKTGFLPVNYYSTDKQDNLFTYLITKIKYAISFSVFLDFKSKISSIIRSSKFQSSIIDKINA